MKKMYLHFVKVLVLSGLLLSFSDKATAQIVFCCCGGPPFLCIPLEGTECSDTCFPLFPLGNPAGYPGDPNCTGSPCDPGGPTAVELVSFQGFSTPGGQTKLSWRTVSEINNLGFEIERADSPELDWEKIAFVEGNGTTNQTQNYAYLDVTAPRGLNYYRLKQIDYESTSNYSDIIAVSFTDVDDLVDIWPIPAKDILYVHYKGLSKTDTDFRVQVFDMFGKKRWETYTQENQLNLGNLEPGSYFIQFSVSQKKITKHLSIVR